MTDNVTINSENNGPSLEDEALAQEASAQATKNDEPRLAGEEEAPQRPEWLPEKFESPEDMAKAYSDLETKLGKGEATQEETAQAAEQAVEGAGLDMDALSTEFEANGELTAESYDALAKVGITKDMVESYIAGQTSQAESIQADLLEPLGGDVEAYNEMTTWAAENLPDSEIDAFNSILESGDINQMRMAIQHLSGKYSGSVGKEPGRSLSGKGTSTSGGVYESTADLMKDMQSPEYDSNPAFRAKVEAKLGRSSIL